MKTLAKRFGDIVAWPFPLFLLSEVRVSATGQRALERRASREGITCVWSDPPPPSPTFSVSPGGTAILARAPLVAKTQPVPELQQWVSAARVCIARVTYPCVSELSSSFVAFVIYGFPESHAERGRNDELLRDVFVSLGAWKSPILVAGDLNTTISHSATLSQADQWGFQRVSPNIATTVNKEGSPSRGLPIDHMLANLPMLDILTECKVDWGVAISDHFPITATIALIKCAFRVARWPQTPYLADLPERTCVVFPDVPQMCSFQKWQELACRWLATTLGVKIPSKTKSGTKPYKPQRIPIDHCYRRLLAVERAIAHILEHGETCEKVQALNRKLVTVHKHHHLVLTTNTWNEQLLEVRGWVREYTNHAHGVMLKKWRKEAITWKVSTKVAYAYLRNPLPMKTTMLEVDGNITCHPHEVEKAMNQYWHEKESWPSNMNAELAIDNLENYYGLFLPSFPYDHTFEVHHLIRAVKDAKHTAPGLDAWTLRELKTLPDAAYVALHEILMNRFEQIEVSLSACVKRVPLEKVTGAKKPEQLRPIDLFSAIMRVFSSAAFAIVRPWAMNVLHKDQCASKGGTFGGAARVALLTELALEFS